MTASLIALASGVYNLARIRKVVPAPDDKDGYARVRIVWDGETNEEVVSESIDTFANLAGTLVPAPPGFQVISCFKDADSVVFLDPVPVIAFRITGTAAEETAPVTLEGHPNRSHDTAFAVIAPDGRCCDPGETGMISLDEWKRHATRRLTAG